MRPLKIAKIPTPAQQAEAAAALQWLEQQPVPEGLSEAEVTARLRYIITVAKQYEKLGLTLRELVEVGYRAGLVAPDLWNWRVRAGMAEGVER